MKVRTSILLICLAAISMNIGWAQTKVHDSDGQEWTCRPSSDGNIYLNLGSIHIYNIAAAKSQGEPHGGEPHAPHDPQKDHPPLCIDALGAHQIIWYWPGADHISVSFVPEAKKDGTCKKSKNPFPKTPKDSGIFPFLRSRLADDTYSGCVYDMRFESSLGNYDPHIIINGGRNDSAEQLKDDLAEVQNDLEDMKILKGYEEKLEAAINKSKQPKK